MKKEKDTCQGRNADRNTKNETYTSYRQDKITYHLSYDRPSFRKGTDEPVRARVNLRLPGGKRYLRKSDLDPNASDTPLDRVLYGHSEKDIYTHKLPSLAAQMQAELLASSLVGSQAEALQGEDLGWLIATHAEDILAVCCSAVTENTRATYRARMLQLAKLCRGIDPTRLHGDVLEGLRYKVREAAAQNSRHYQDWQPGDEDPSAARQQFYLLGLVLDYLIGLGYDIPADALQRDTSQTSPQALALQRTDSARSYPPQAFHAMLAALDPDELHTPILLTQAFTGMRIAEVCGLLWSDFAVLPGWQGVQYMIRVSGQLGDGSRSGMRIDTPKTDNGSRYIPLPGWLGQQLAQRRQKLALTGRKLNLLPIWLDDPTASREEIAEFNRKLVDSYRQFATNALRTTLYEPLRRARAFVFDAGAQDRQLREMLTPHSLRRRYLTDLYGRSMETPEEIHRATGHADPERKPRARRCAPNRDEQYRMCLRYALAGIGLSEPAVLCCELGRDDGTTDPCLRLELTVPPHGRGQMVIYEQEPGTALQVSASGVIVTETNRLPQAPSLTRERLLAGWRAWEVTDTSQPLQHTDGSSWDKLLNRL